MGDRSPHGKVFAAPGLCNVLDRRKPNAVDRSATILVVEDDPAVLRVVIRLLHSHGYRTLSTGRGLEALALIDAHPDIDIVLLDIVLPDMSGTQVAAAINARRSDTPIVFVTGTGNVGDLKGLEEGRLLRKPFTERELFDGIAAAMRRH